MNKKDIRNLVVIWVIGFGLAGLLAAWLYFGYNEKTVLASPTKDSDITSFITQPTTTIAQQVHGNLIWTVIVIMPFLFAPIITLFYCIVRFSKKNNPHADQTHEHVALEVFWTITPALFLAAMALPAYVILKKMETSPKKPDLVVDVVGNQFFWQYKFPKYGDMTVVDSGAIEKSLDPKTGFIDDVLYLPVNKVVLLNGQSTQVNHAWWVPAFGIKFDVIPGRITGGWIEPKQEGFYKGQCAELCGTGHGFMLIHVKVVSEKEFYAWLKAKKAKFPADEQEKVARLLGDDSKKVAMAN